MVNGMPFGIHKMCIWLLPKNFGYRRNCWCLGNEYNSGLSDWRGGSRMVDTSCCVYLGKIFYERAKIKGVK